MKLNKKLLFILFIIIFTISSVSATDEVNSTHVEYNNLDSNKSTHNDIESNEDMNSVNLSINQGNKIPLIINSSVEGSVEIFIDGKLEYNYLFDLEDKLNINTFNTNSFDIENSNLNIGLHNITFIFNFDRNWNFNPKIEVVNSSYYFKFSYNHDENYNNFYSYTSSFKILEKNKSVHILNDYFEKIYSYDYNINIHFDDLTDDYYLIGIIISNETKVVHKTKEFIKIDEFGNCIYNVPYLDSGTYNLTIINLEDGQSDTISFKNLKKKLNFLNHT